MANVNANLPMWSKAFWSQDERDKRQEAADRKEFERTLIERVILQKMINEGRISEQQAADAAAASRQDKDLTYKEKEAVKQRQFLGDETMYREMMENDRRATTSRDRLKAEFGPNWETSYEGRRKLKEQEAEVDWMNAVGQLGGANAFGPNVEEWPELIRKRAGFPAAEAPASSPTKRQPVFNTRRAAVGLPAEPAPQPGELQRGNTSAPPISAPAGPQPTQEGLLKPSPADEKLRQDWLLLQKRLLIPTPK